MKALNLSIPVQTELYLLDLDQRKLRNFCREHDYSNMAKRKQNEHTKIRAHLEQVKRDQARNATYTSRTGCDTDAGDVGGGGAVVGGEVAAAATTNHCKWADYGCSGDKKHKTERSKHCKFYGKKKESIIGKIFHIFKSLLMLNYTNIYILLFLDIVQIP